MVISVIAWEDICSILPRGECNLYKSKVDLYFPGLSGTHQTLFLCSFVPLFHHLPTPHVNQLRVRVGTFVDLDSMASCSDGLCRDDGSQGRIPVTGYGHGKD